MAAIEQVLCINYLKFIYAVSSSIDRNNCFSTIDRLQIEVAGVHEMVGPEYAWTAHKLIDHRSTLPPQGTQGCPGHSAVAAVGLWDALFGIRRSEETPGSHGQVMCTCHGEKSQVLFIFSVSMWYQRAGKIAASCGPIWVFKGFLLKPFASEDTKLGCGSDH